MKCSTQGDTPGKRCSEELASVPAPASRLLCPDGAEPQYKGPAEAGRHGRGGRGCGASEEEEGMGFNEGAVENAERWGVALTVKGYRSALSGGEWAFLGFLWRVRGTSHGTVDRAEKGRQGRANGRQRKLRRASTAQLLQRGDRGGDLGPVTK